MIKRPDKKENMKTIYNHLTGINIDEQKLLWDERGKGYYGEAITFEEIYNNVFGNFKILMNLNIPKNQFSEDTTEIDLLMIHETGIYVFECKHYKGTIYGDGKNKTWTQFFKTQQNEHFYNPILQNKGHIQALQNMFPNIKCFSFIIFTNSFCDIRVQHNEPNTYVCKFSQMSNKLNNLIKSKPAIFSIENIEEIFNSLLPYSSMNNELENSNNNTVATFNQWLTPILSDFDNARIEYIEKAEVAKKTIKFKKVYTALTVILCIIATMLFCFCQKSNYEKQREEIKNECNKIVQEKIDELEEFKENFVFTNQNNDNLTNKPNESNKQEQSNNEATQTDYDDIYNVSNAVFYNTSFIKFSAKLTATSPQFGFKLTENSQYIVTASNGKTYRYNVFGTHLKYDEKSNTLAGNNKSGTLKQINLTDFKNKEEVLYIKLSQIEVFDLQTNKVIDTIEIELYKTPY